MSSIKDVARLAGVSYTTVSHVINSTRRVSDEARQRVLLAVQVSGYVPSQVARSLRASSTQVLGILVPDICNPFCAEITRGFELAAHEAGYGMVLGNTRFSDPGQGLQVERMLSRRVDGLLVVAGVFEHARLADTLRQHIARRDMPVLLIDHEAGDLHADVLVADSFDAAFEATQHLTELGHRRIACLSGPMSLGISAERVRGWRAALAAVGVEPPLDWLFEGAFDLDSGYRLGLACLKPFTARGGAADRALTAVLACNDMMAIGVLRAAAELGVTVPERLSVMGIDGVELGQYVQPTLSTVGEPLRRVGEQAARMLLDRIASPAGASAPLQRMQRACHVMARGSTAPVHTPSHTGLM